EPYSNALIVTSNSKESLAVLEDVIKQLDQPSEAGESTLRVQLKFAKAPNVANSINILFAKNGSPPLRALQPNLPQQNNAQQQQQQQQQGGLSQTSFALEQETKEEGYYPWLGGQPDNPRSSDNRNAVRPVSDLGTGTLSSTINMDFLIQFLRQTTGAKVLDAPQINVADNEMGKQFVGQQVPFIDKSQTTDVGALNQTFTYKDVGVILEVTPHINNEGDVALKIRAESSAIVPGQTLLGGAIINTRDFRTDLKAKTGETLVLGGIIQEQTSETIYKTPILGDIPGLGWAFKKRDKTSHEV